MNSNYELLETFSKNNETWSYLRHKKTGLEIAFHQCETEETGFSFNFNTPVDDPYLGTTHVLEHCILQGSQKYSLSFLELLKLSCFSNFNAVTEDLKTRYFFYSPLEDECLKLLPVMGDYVFFPELSDEAFMQECMRIEFDPSGDQRKKKIAGVVYNEMKASYSDSLLSGGAYYRLNELTNEKIKEYHTKYYRPDNCLFVFNGNTSLETVLKTLDPFVSDLEAKFNEETIIPRRNLTVQEILDKVPFKEIPADLEHHTASKEEPLPPKKTTSKIMSEYLGKFSSEEYRIKLERLHKWQGRDAREKMLEIMKPLAVNEYDIEIVKTEKDLKEYFDKQKDFIERHFKKYGEVEIELEKKSCSISLKSSAQLTRKFYGEYALCIFLQGFLSTKLRQKGCLYDLGTAFGVYSTFQIYTLYDRKPEESLELIKKELIELADYDFSETDLMIIKSAVYTSLFIKNTSCYFSEKIFDVTKEDLHNAAIRFKKMIENHSTGIA